MAKTTRAKRPELTEKIQKDTKPKGPIKYGVDLNEEQKEAKRLIYNNKVIIITGKAGSGKTLVAVIAALDHLFKKEIKKMYITRPNVAKEDYGFLPGDLNEKMDPFLIPIYDNLHKCYDEAKIKTLLEEKLIDIAPIGFMRGRTFDGILIIDEAQNVKHDDLEMCLTRMGKNSKIIICGDSAQIDLKKKTDSALNFAIEMSNKVNGMTHIDLKQNHRDEIVEAIMEQYELKRQADEDAEAAKKQQNTRPNKKQVLKG